MIVDPDTFKVSTIKKITEVINGHNCFPPTLATIQKI
jgi:hypothetical protein